MNLVSIATVQDKHNVPFVQKVSNVKTLLQNPQHVQRVFTVLRVMQHVQFAQRGMNVQMVHRPEYVLRDSLHPSVPQHVRPVLLVIDAHVKACLPLRAVQRDGTPTRPRKWDVTLVKPGGNVQMVIDLCHVLLAILVNMGSPTVHPVNQESTAALVHLCVCHVLLENNVWTLVSSQWIVLMGHFLALEKVFVRCVLKVTRPHQAGLLVCHVQKASTALIQVILQYLVLLACILWEVDLKTAQYAQLEMHALTLLVHLWLALERRMLRHYPQHARLALLVTAALRTKELKYVHLMILLDTFIVLTQWYHVHNAPMQAQDRFVNLDTSYPSTVMLENFPARMELSV